MPQIQCIGADGIARTFEWTYLNDRFEPQHTFRIETIPPLANGEAFELTFIDLDASTVRETWIGSPSQEPEYRAKGIPDAMLPTVKAHLGREIQSSPQMGAGSGTYRTVDAEKMWKRLVAKKLAEYNQSIDAYRVL